MGIRNVGLTFFPVFGHPDFIFPKHSRINEEGSKLHEKTSHFGPCLIKNALRCKFYLKQLVFVIIWKPNSVGHWTAPTGALLPRVVTGHQTMFFDRHKGRPKPRKGLDMWIPRRNFEPTDLPKGNLPTKEGAQKGGPFRVLGDAVVPEFARHPVCKVEKSITVSRTPRRGSTGQEAPRGTSPSGRPDQRVAFGHKKGQGQKITTL